MSERPVSHGAAVRGGALRILKNKMNRPNRPHRKRAALEHLAVEVRLQASPQRERAVGARPAGPEPDRVLERPPPAERAARARAALGAPVVAAWDEK